MKRTHIENFAGILLIIVAVFTQLFRVQSTRYLNYLFLVFFILLMLLHTRDAMRDKTYNQKTFWNVYGLLILSLLGELPVAAMHRNSAAVYQQAITSVIQSLIFILVLQAIISAILILVYRNKSEK